MTRNRASAKKAGSDFERQVADYLKHRVDDRVDRRVRTGVKDRGDITGLRAWSQPVVVECKNYGGRVVVSEWLTEAETERGNDDALAGVVVAKRRGTTNPGDQLVMMTLGDFAAILTGDRTDG